MTRAPIVLATCAAWPALSPSDQRLAAALIARGHRVEATPWNGPAAPFTTAAAVVIRSTWDYHEAPDAYLAWLSALDPARTFNTPPLIRWNLSKAHVIDLGARGAHIPRSLEVDADADAISGALQALGVDEAVIKPLIGASGAGVERVQRGGEVAALARARMRKTFDRVLVQEFMAEIEHGELAGVFFDGVFSHGLRRRPATGDFRVNTQHGGRKEATDLEPAVVRAMSAVLGLLPELPLYVRVDGLLRGGRFVLMELEVNEPALGLDLVAPAAARFADALLVRLPALTNTSA